MNTASRIFFVFAFSFLAGILVAQTKIGEGKLMMKFTFPDTLSAQQQLVSLLPREQTIWFKNGNTRNESKSGMGNLIMIHDAATGESFACMDMMGKKLALRSTKQSLSKLRGMMDLGKPEIKIGEETRVIAGLNCRKATVTYPDKIPPFEAWFTKDVTVTNSPETLIEGIDGFVMESRTLMRGMILRSTCTSFEKVTVNDSLFKLPDGYKVMDMDQMMNQKPK
ncbi:MAG: hypothetical protein WCO44_04990 [Bacteroidota bacterium]